MFSCPHLLLLVCALTVLHGQNSPTALQCDVPQGMKSGGIPDSALVVSSTDNDKRQARYDCCQTDCGAAWCPAKDDHSPYFEVHLENLTTIASIKFQHPTSRTNKCNQFSDKYMKTFRLLYKPVIGSEEFLEFNHGISSIYNESVSYWVEFKPYFVTKAIRIEPQTSEKAACFKFEIYGCEPTGLCQKDFCRHGGTCVGENLCRCKGAYYGEQCQYPERDLYTLVTKFLFLRIQNTILLTTSLNMSVSGSVTVETVGTQSLLRLGEGGTASVAPGSGHLPPCWHNMDACQSGFTYSLTVNIEKMTSQRLYLISSGEEAAHNGLWLYYEGNTLSCHVATSSEVWRIDVSTLLSLSQWYTFEISWNRILGLQLLLNSKTVGSITQSIARQSQKVQAADLSIGSSLNTHVVMRVYQLQVVPLVRSEVIRARLTNDTSPPVLPSKPTRPGECKAALGMETGTIRSDQLSASTPAAGHHKDDARYGPKEGVAGTSWCPIPSTQSFYEVHLEKPTAIAAIRFQHPQINTTYYPEYMKTFRLLFRDVHADAKEMIEFSQNVPAIYNKTTAMTIYLSPKIVTDKIRFEPQTWESKACFRFELLGCDPKDLCEADFCRNGGSCIGEKVCICPTGYFGKTCDATTVTVIKYIFLRVEHNIVVTPTRNFTTHGTVTLDHSLITLTKGGYLEMPLSTDCLSHLDTCTSGFTFTLTLKFTTHLSMEKVYIVSSGGDTDGVEGIALYYQGKAFHCYVTTSSMRWYLQVSYNLETSQWYRLRVSWSPSRGLTLIEGNSVIGTSFSIAGVLIHATKTQPLKIGYTETDTVTLVIQEITTAELVYGEIQRAGVTDSPFPATRVTTTVSTTHSTPTQLCDSRLGMADKTISDGQLTVSTSSPGHDKEQMRYGCCTDEHIGGWCSLDTDSHPWVQVKLKTAMAISKILFQHPAKMNRTVNPSQNVKDIQMLYNNPLRDDSQLELYSQEIPVPHNATVSYSVTLKPVVVTDTVQFVVTDDVERPCMRLELVGCDPKVLCPPNFCQNGGSCIGENVCKCRDGYYGIQCQLRKSEIPYYNYKVIEMIKHIITTTHLNLTVHGKVHVNSQLSEKFLVLSNQGYVEIPQTDPCVQDLDHCKSGFTYTININLRSVAKEMPILGTGNGATGVYLSYTNGSFTCSVGTSKGVWTVSVRHHLTLETWYKIDLSWSSFHGLHLHVDGVDIGGSVATVGTSPTFAKHLLWIGNGYMALPSSGTFIFWIKQIQIFFSVHQDLVRAGLLEEKNPTPTPAIPLATTAKPEASSCNSSFTDITFIRINGTDLVTSLSTMKVHGDAYLEQSKEGTLLVLDGPGQYIDMQKTGVPCLDDLTTCSTSFNFRLTFQFIKIDMQPNYILSSGGEAVNSSGVALYYYNGRLFFWVKNGKSVGKSIFSVNMENATWYTLDASWDKTSEETSVQLNGRALKNTPLPKTSAPETSMTHSLLIGKSWDKNLTSHIKLLLFRMWTDSLKELAENNCTEELSIPDVTTATGLVSGLPTPKATSAKTTIPPVHHQFTFTSVIGNILVTTDYNLTLHGKASLEEGQQGKGKVISITRPKQWIEMNPEKVSCLSDMNTCYNGITAQVEMKIVEMKNMATIYLLRVGNSHATSPLLLYYQGRQLHATIHVGKTIWSVSTDYNLTIMQSHVYQVVWSRQKGIQLVVDGIVLNESVTSTQTNVTANTLHALVIGEVENVASIHLQISQIEVWNKRKETDNKQTSVKQTATERTPAKSSITTLDTGLVSGLPTPKATLAKTTSQTIPPVHHQFTFTSVIGNILVTTDYNLTLHGKASLEEGQQGKGKVISITRPKQWIEMNPEKVSCLSDMNTCYNGITAQVEMKIVEMKNMATIYLLRVGNSHATSPLLLYYQGRQLHATIHVGKTIWSVSTDYNLTIMQSHVYQVVWSRQKGIQLVVDGIVLNESVTSTQTNVTANTLHALVIGEVENVASIHLQISQIEVWNKRKETDNKQTSVKQTATERTPAKSSITTLDTGLVSGLPTPKATLAKTTSQTIPPVHHQFTFTSVIGNILVTTDYNLTLHGKASLEEGQQGKGKVISITGPKQWIEMNPEKVSCLSDMNTCYNGITAQVEMKIVEMKNMATIYLLRVGNSHATSPLLLYYQGRQLHATIHVGKTIWSVSTDYNLTIMQSHVYQVVWSRQKGIQLVVDGIVLNESVTSTQTNVTANTLHALVIGEVENVASIHLQISQIEVWNKRKETDNKQTSVKQTATERTPAKSSITTLDTGLVSGLPTPKATLAKTTSQTIPPVHHQFTFTSVIGNILVTTDYNLTLHGKASLEEGQQGKGKVISITGPKQWIEMNPEKVSCLSDMNTCYNGITAQVEMKIVEMKNMATIYLLRVGNSHATSPLLLYYQGRQLHATIHVGKTIWSVSTDYNLTIMQSHVYQVVWSRQKGIQLVVDGIVLNESVTSTQTNVTANTLHALVIGEVENVASIHLQISQIEVWNKRKETDNKQTSVKQTATERTPAKSSITTLDTGLVSGLPTPKATLAKTTSQTIPPVHHQFTFTSVIGNILVTTDYNLTLHGKASLEEGQQGKGKVISITGPKQWIEMNPEKVSCLSDMNTCYNGITAQVEMKIVEMKNMATIYLLRVGNSHATSPLLLYYQGRQLHATIHVGKTIWSVSTDYNLTIMQSHVYQVVWSRQKGIQLVVDGIVLNESVTSTQTNVTANTLHALVIGEVENVASIHLQISQIEVWNKRKETDNKQTSVKQTATERTPAKSSITTLDTGLVSGLPTPKATLAKTTSQTIPPVHHQFTFTSVIGNILVTTDYNLTLHGKASLEEGQQGKGKVISITGPKQWIEMNPEKVSCLSDMNTCYNGITAQVEMKIVEMKNMATIYLLRVGNSHATSPLLLYYQGRQLHATIHVGKTIWSVSTDYNLTIMQSHVYQVVWSRQKGIQLVVDGIVLNESVTSTQTNVTANTLHALVIGEVENVASIHLQISQIEVWNKRKETDNKQTSVKQTATERTPAKSSITTLDTGLVSGLPTPKATLAKTTSQTIPPVHHQFTFTSVIGNILVTTDYNLTLHGKASLEEGQQGKGKVISITRPKQWIEMNPEKVSCLSDMNTCYNGITAQVEMKIVEMKNMATIYLLRVGNSHATSPLLLYYQGRQLHATIHVGKTIWSVSTDYNLTIMQSHVYQVVWSRQKGIQLVVDGIVLNESVTSTQTNVTANTLHALVIGEVENVASIHLQISQIEVWNKRKETDNKQTSVKQTATERTPAKSSITTLDTGLVSGLPTPKATSAKTTSQTIPPVHHQFTFTSVIGNILVTTDYNLTLHGKASLEEGQQGKGKVISITGPKQWIEMNPEKVSCLSDMNTCYNGITAQVEMKIVEMKNMATIYLLRVGNSHATSPLLLYYQGRQLHATIHVGKTIWSVSTDYNLTIMQSHVYQVVWSRQKGIQLVVDGIVLNESVTSTQTNVTANTLHALVIGEVENVASIHLQISQIEVWNKRKETDNKQTSVKQYPTATTTESTTVIETNIESIDLTFTGIFGNVVTTKSLNMTINGNASLLTRDNLTYLQLNGRNQWLEIPQEIVPCASEPKACISGFTFQIDIEVKIIPPLKLINFISSGNNNPSLISMFYKENTLFVIVTLGHEKWMISTMYTIGIDKCNTYQISWSNSEGSKLYVNNVLLAVQQIPVTVPSNITTTVPASGIRIGGSQGQFLVTNVHSWTTTRAILAARGILPRPIETCNVKPVSWTNMTIDMSFLRVSGHRLTTKDMLIMTHGNPTLIKTKDMLSLDISHPGQYVEIETKCLPCFSDLVHCTTGFTVQLVATFTHIESTGRMYIVDNGQDKPEYTEVNLFYERGHLKGVIASGQHKWLINIPYKFEVNVPYTFHISWSQISGYQLYVNEHVTQKTQSLPAFVSATKVPSSFLIGKASDVNKTTPMIITDFKLFSATRTELVKLGILKPALTTISTTTLFPPTSPPLPEFMWSFGNVTSKYLNSSYLQLIIHGGVEAHSAGLVFTTDKQYLEIQHLAKSCLTDITKCRHGLTISVEMVFTSLIENTVVFTTGGEAPDLPGVSMLYRYGHFQVIVSSPVKAWFVSIPRDHIKLDTKHVIYIYFKETLKVYINRELVASSVNYVSHPDTSGALKNVFYFGKSFTTSTTGHHLQCILKAIHIWYQGIDLAPQLTSPTAVTSSPGICPVGCISLASSPRSETTTPKKFPPTHPPATTPTTTTMQPRTTQDIGTPPFNVDLTVMPIVDMTGTYLACKLSAYTAQDVLIQFQWIIDGVPQVMKEVHTPVTEGRLYISEVKNVNDNLYDKEIICNARAKFTAGWQWTQKLTSQTPFIPTITSMTSTTAHLTVTEGQQVRQIELKSNCPPQLFCKFTDKGNCKVELVASLLKHPMDHLCTRETVLPQIVIQSSGNTTDVCGTGMTSSNWKNVIQIPMKATIDGLYDHDQTRDILVKLKTTGAFKESMYKTIAKYTVKAKDSDKSAQCASLNDPHITTFDGLHYNNFQRGEFVLYKHKTLPYEVRTSYRICSSRNSRGPTCNCAVAVKSGDDVITFTGCHGSTRQSYFGRFFRQVTSITVEMYKNGELTPGTTVRRIGCGQKYEVRLPTGTIVTIQSSYLSFINVWVRPSAVDFRQSEGLCGSFTGNKNDDLFGADHKTYTVKHTPDGFSRTWLVSERNTMFHGVAAEKTTTETYCSCVEGRHLYCAPRLDIFRCTATSSRDDITATLVRQAKLPSAAFRRFKRETPMEAEPLEEDTGVSTYTEQSARSYCEDYINKQPAKQACEDYVTVTDDLIRDCAQDLMETGDEDWAHSHLDDIVAKCIGEAERNVSMWNDSENTTIWESIPKDIMNKLCTGGCVHGNCSEGSCVCEEGYTGLNCSISKDVSPDILPVNEDGGGCNINHMDCSQIAIMGLNFVNSDTLGCFYQPVNVTSHVVATDQWIPAPATFLSMYQVVCSLPSPQSARVAVSNNGQQRSSQSYLHIVFDDCHACEVNEKGTDASCSRQTVTCLINGACYQDGDKKPGDHCQLCDPQVNTDNWTTDSDPICTATKLQGTSLTTSGVSVATIALAVVVAVCAVVIIAGVVAICRKRSTAQRKKIVEEGDFNSPQSRLSSKSHPNLRNISFGNLTYDGSAASLASPEMTETH